MRERMESRFDVRGRSINKIKKNHENRNYLFNINYLVIQLRVSNLGKCDNFIMLSWYDIFILLCNYNFLYLCFLTLYPSL